MKHLIIAVLFVDDNSATQGTASPAILRAQAARAAKPTWRVVQSRSEFLTTPPWGGSTYVADSILDPVTYFKRFFDEELLDHIVHQSNLYSVQENPSDPLQLTQREFSKFLAVVLNMSIISLPRTRLYWSLSLGVNQISDIMSRTRFEAIKKYVHFNDNSSTLTPGDEGFDKLFKVRPLLDHLRAKFNSIPMDQMLCIDEQMIPFKGASSLKQYIPKKPHKYGYKVFVLCSHKGIIHDFELYSGKIEPPENSDIDLEASSNIVLRLAEQIPSHVNLLYFDNWFTSIPLQKELAKREIFYLGTVRSNHLQGCTLSSDKELKKKGRGTFQEKECILDSTPVRVIKWMDSKPVTLLTTFESAEPTSVVKRWDRKEKKKVEVPCPKAVKTYNQFMGGVDLFDSLIGLYRIKLRSKKYYHRIFFHFLDLSVVTAWLSYRKDCDEMGISVNKGKTLMEFKLAISNALAKEGQFVARRRGRPSTGVEITHDIKKARGHNTKPIPPKCVRRDHVDHLPIFKEKRGRCKLPGCSSSPFSFCEKCECYLCFERKKNYFYAFHTE